MSMSNATQYAALVSLAEPDEAAPIAAITSGNLTVEMTSV